MPKNIIIMGVSGSGKSTVASLLASTLQLTYYDADDFHSDSNKSKMSSGKPLTDEDRTPWLNTLNNLLTTRENLVLACSALKEKYRTILDPDNQYNWVYLKGPKELIRLRMESRPNHFMKANLLESQLATLEVPENAITIDIEKKPDEIVRAIVNLLK